MVGVRVGSCLGEQVTGQGRVRLASTHLSAPYHPRTAFPFFPNNFSLPSVLYRYGRADKFAANS